MLRLAPYYLETTGVLYFPNRAKLTSPCVADYSTDRIVFYPKGREAEVIALVSLFRVVHSLLPEG